MTELLMSALVLLGAGFMLLASVGILRLPDTPTRMHASTKAAALGVMLIMAAVSLHFAEFSVFTRAIAIVAFILLTAPIGAHVIGRAAYFMGTPLWHGTIKDELKACYEEKNHRLSSEVEEDNSGKV